MPTLTYNDKKHTLQPWTHGDIYTMTTTVKSYSNINTQWSKAFKHLQIAAAAFMCHDSNILPYSSDNDK